MAWNLIEKVLRTYLKEGEYVPGKEIGIRIDQTLVHDATGIMVFLRFEAPGLS
jgi:aconitate hydratase